MKHTLTFFVLFLVNFAEAQLMIEITQGSNNPFKLGIIAKSESDKEQAATINYIIQQDLVRTGDFTIINEAESDAVKDAELPFTLWKLMKIDFIAITELFKEEESGLRLEYRVFDVSKGKLIRESKIFGIPNQIRQLAHYASDGIFEVITGIRGIAATKLLYVVERTENREKFFQLMLADSDGANEQILLESDQPIISPTWSRDSKWVAYVSFESGEAAVYIQEISSGKRERVLERGTQISAPAFSPDGKYLSLTLYDDGNAEIYILRLKDKALTRITNHFAIDTESSWSSKGDKLLFTSSRAGGPQLYELNLSKLRNNPERLTFEGSYNAKGSYLPNDDGLIFVHRNDKGQFQIALQYANERFLRPLTDAKLDESPSVAPNGNMIVYAITDGADSLLAGFSLSGAKFRYPIKNGKVREPAWSYYIR
ncbi:MAG: Tol-Pal system beta propeller repeat protein TolB [Gammaproteobacteria bacterium]